MMALASYPGLWWWSPDDLLTLDSGGWFPKGITPHKPEYEEQERFTTRPSTTYTFRSQYS